MDVDWDLVRHHFVRHSIGAGGATSAVAYAGAWWFSVPVPAVALGIALLSAGGLVVLLRGDAGPAAGPDDPVGGFGGPTPGSTNREPAYFLCGLLGFALLVVAARIAALAVG